MTGVDRRIDVDRLAVEQDLSAVRRMDAHERLHQRALAGAIVADERHDLLWIDREARAPERLHAPEALDDVPRLKDGFGHHPPPLSSSFLLRSETRYRRIRKESSLFETIRAWLRCSDELDVITRAQLFDG